jgi:hypothetical protein
MKLLQHILTVFIVMLCLLVFNTLRAIFFEGNYSLLPLIHLIPKLLPMILVSGIVVRTLEHLPWRINPGIYFAIIYTFIAFPLPPFLGGPDRYWWAYPLAIIQIILSGFLYSFFLNFINSKFRNKIS